MANLKEVRNRIVSVNSTQQITKAMKMVSAAKLKRAVDASSVMAPYSERLRKMMGKIYSELEEIQNPFAQSRAVKKILVLVITSNRGLAGAFNSNIIRMASRFIDSLSGQVQKENIILIAIGKKGAEFFKRKGFELAGNYSEIYNKLDYDASSVIADRIMQGYQNGEWDQVELFYNRFKNATLQIQENITLVPIKSGKPEQEEPVKGYIDNYLFEPNVEELVNYLIPESIRASLFSSLLSSFAAEHGARMTSMEKATENATELIKFLKLQYNRARQASITNEILEIVSGANALEQA